jgi:histidyl-tRNA synthetase
VFEWVTDQLGAQGTVCAGGRYDGLIEQLGGKPAPAAGFAMGIERLLSLMEVAGTPLATAVPDAYIVHAGDAAQGFAWQVASALRSAGLAAVLHCGGGSFKSQMKKADASRARYAVIIGDDEAAAQQVTLKPLRGTGEQTRVEVTLAIEYLKNAII